MDIQQALARVVEGRHLEAAEMQDVMRAIMAGEATEAQIGGFLVALRMKGETIDEIAAAVGVMRELATPVEVSDEHLVDIVGTGGDEANLFNVSTASAFVIAAAGGRVAKHGNRSFSSTSGSSDLLESLGVPLDLAPAEIARCIDEVGMGFMFAPAHHSAMKHVVGPRRELGLRTLFNILGPMTNPARVKRQLIGVYDPALCRPMAEVLCKLGSEQVMVVHSEDGLDELSIAGPSRVAELRSGEVSEYRLSPADVGLEAGPLDGLAVGSAAESAAMIRAAFDNDQAEPVQRAARMIALNAGAAIYVTGLTATVADGVRMAEDAIASGAAAQKVEELSAFGKAVLAAR
jgi:anthranilate phosphoribosyltransferase